MIYLILFSLILKAAAGGNGLAMTPQMGWNTWNSFGCDIDEDLILSSAQAIKDKNLTSFGYECKYRYVQRTTSDNTTGAPVADPVRFPNGLKHVADQIHSLGLKANLPGFIAGIYSDAGTFTCEGHFGSLGFEEIDAATYASWGMDYLKYDNCYNEGREGTPLISEERYANMSRALDATGRPILFSLCNWGVDGPWNWAPTIAHSWRISGDIMDNYDRFDDRCPCTSVIDCKLPGNNCAMTRIIDFAAPLSEKAGPGRWNDADMLEVGNGGMTFDEYGTMWAVIKSPLILGNDVRNMTAETLEIITNKAIIAVNQDPLGSTGIRVWKKTIPSGGDLQLWYGSLVNSTWVIAVMNTSPEDQSTNITFSEGATERTQTYELFDLWDKDDAGDWGKSLGTFSGSLPETTVKSHQTKVFRAVPVSAQTKKDVSEL
ncbi:Alpha-galactosidase [Mycena venus]|uniref:Alpha-galactosidase n=1 Tax=Mycena venus TaxID=2733690 RepID=A0A8H7CR26_9AGAR|nr:Alpha-galactosidase [Mycena venus]